MLLPCVDSPSTENTEAAFERMVAERDLLSAHIRHLVKTRDFLDLLIEASRSSLSQDHPAGAR